MSSRIREAGLLACLLAAVGCGPPRDTNVDAGDSGQPEDAGEADAGRCSVESGDVFITSSEDWAALISAGCMAINGTLTIEGIGSPTLLPATALTKVGSLVVQNSTLTGLAFPALTTIARDLAVTRNASLKALSLPSLETVGGDFWIFGNALTELSVPELNKATGGLRISEEVTSLSFPMLATVGGKFSIVSTTLESLSFPSLATADEVYIWGTALTTLSLPLLARVRGDLNVSGNNALVTLEFPKLATVSVGTLFIYENYFLTSASFPSLTFMNGLFMTSNDSLTSLSMPTLVSIGIGGASVGRTRLATLTFPSLRRAGGPWLLLQVQPDLEAVSLPSLTTVDGSLGVLGPKFTTANLPVLVSVGGNLLLGTKLSALRLPALETVGSLDLISPVLTSLSLPALHSAGSLKIGSLLTDVTLPSLQRLSWLSIEGSVVSSVSLPKLETIERLSAIRNPRLTQLNFPALASVTYFDVRDNSSLPQCAVDALKDNLRLAPTLYVVGGNSGMPNECP